MKQFFTEHRIDYRHNLADLAAFGLCLLVAYIIRFEGTDDFPRYYLRQFLLVLPYVLILRLFLFHLFGVYQLVWQYITPRDLPRIVGAMVAGSGVLALVRLFLGPVRDAFHIQLNTGLGAIPFGVLLIELVITTSAVVGMRLLRRIMSEHGKTLHLQKAGQGSGGAEKQRALLIGAGSAGLMVAREVQENPAVGFEVVGFLDDDPDKQRARIFGHRVLGSTHELAQVARDQEATLAVISMASVGANVVRRIVDLAEAADLEVKTIPGLYEILSGKVNISELRDVALEDLLGREPVKLEEDQIREFLRGKVVLVSGAGGSIGSEICRQVCRYQPKLLVLLDQAENPLFHIHRELTASYPEVPLQNVVGSVANRDRMEYAMREVKPDVVFHAAAHKHVPLMEQNPGEAIRNNVMGSRIMAETAQEVGADAFVMISTDKAVNPSSVMGASKRAAEMFVQALGAHSETRFITVRFGNVLGSQGSVVPIFKEQIARGGPVTVTHPDMKRYFMTIPEASQLVLQAATMGTGGEIFILDMGEPVLITNLAKDLIRLSRADQKATIEVVYTGIRPGEKLYEEINLGEENAAKTRHPRIWIGKGRVTDLDTMRRQVDTLFHLVEQGKVDASLQGLYALIPEFKHQRQESEKVREREAKRSHPDPAALASAARAS